ncbi:MAG: hypothetical protein KF774_04670 [Planctomyces sp.]|nr:hypothetical protein [Planctomyces sp.]
MELRRPAHQNAARFSAFPALRSIAGDMGVLIGMDEAGLGPNLGPFVVALTVWEFPGQSTACDLYKALSDAVSPEPVDDGRLHIADSKQIFSPARGLAALERAALTLLHVAGAEPREFPDLLSRIACGSEVDDWMSAAPPLSLPLECASDAVDKASDRLRHSLGQAGIRLRHLCADAVFPRLFNYGIARTDNKAEVCSRISLNLLKSAWNPGDGDAFVICDRHGGRARYDQLLSTTFDDHFVFRISETPELSRYRLGSSEIRFECRAERQLPVACASIIAKYVRELSMRMFNAFWRSHVPDVRPTQGYPGDARRFADEVASARTALGIADDAFWRAR